MRTGDFLDIAEQTGMIVPIGAWGLRAACAQAGLLRDAGWPGWMSVNLSGRELAEPGLADRVIAALDETGVEADRLWLEIDEAALMRASRAATKQLFALREHGVHVGLDGFGSAHTPLPKLQQLPADFLKIDSAFVAELTANGEIHPAGFDMLAALVQVGTTLGLSVVASGIESELETALLVACGCQYGQGELLACPPTSDNRANTQIMTRVPGPSSRRRIGPRSESRHVSLRVDRDGRIVQSRPRALDGFGRRASDVDGKYACDLFAADDVLTALALLHRAHRDGSVESVQLRMRTADDGEFLARVSARGADGSVDVRIRPCDDTEQESFRAAPAHGRGSTR